MKSLKLFLLLLSTTLWLQAQSFYVLTGVDSYDPMVINNAEKTKKYNKEIKALMLGTSKELGIDTQGHSSRVLAMVIKRIAVGNEAAFQVTLELGEYVKRKGREDEVFALTYLDSYRIAPSNEDLEDELADTIEKLLETFKLQHQEDNKVISNSQTTVSHEDFSKAMKYESDYQTALSKAKKSKKPLMIFMTTSYCPWCRKLESQILAKEDINDRIHQKYVPLMLNYDLKKFPKQFLEENITPTLYIVDPETEKIKEKFVGYNNRGAFLHSVKQEDI